MTKFEYKIARLPAQAVPDGETMLNELGAQGWEIASENGPFLILKRPLPIPVETVTGYPVRAAAGEEIPFGTKPE